MRFKKEILLPTTGLVSVCFISLYNVIYSILYSLGIADIAEKFFYIKPIVSLLTITVLISTRYILIVISNMNQFKKNLDPLIIAQFISLLLIWTIQLKIFTPRSLIIPMGIIGFIGFVLLLWFVFTLAETEDNEIVAIKYLKYFIIVFLLLLVINILPEILTVMTKKVFKVFDNTIMQYIDGLKYIILIPFFLKNIKSINSETINTSA